MRAGKLVLFIVFSVAVLQYFENVSISEKLNVAEANIAELEGEVASTKERAAELDRNLKAAFEELEHKRESLSEAEKIISRLSYSSAREIYTLGVRDKEGIPILLRVQMESGEGRMLIDAEGVLLEPTVQSTMKTALQVAQNITGTDLGKKDIIFKIVNPLSETLELGGDSAGSAMTVGLVALITERQINQGVVITGRINKDGSLGMVSQIEPKAEAAKRANATIFLVPEGQKVYVEGINVIEVSDIQEAMRYMLK